MYTATSDSLVLPLKMTTLLTEPTHGRLHKVNHSEAHIPANYEYIPNNEFVGEDSFTFSTENGANTTVVIYVSRTTSGHTVFIPCIEQKPNKKRVH